MNDETTHRPRTVTVTLQNGIKVPRSMTGKRTYTHALIITDSAGCEGVLSFHTSARLASNATNAAERDFHGTVASVRAVDAPASAPADKTSAEFERIAREKTAARRAREQAKVRAWAKRTGRMRF